MRLPIVALLLLVPVLLRAGEAPAGGVGQSAAGDGLFVAVGYGGFRGWSRDGATWTAERWSGRNEDDDHIIFSVTWRAGIFLAAGGGASKGFVLRSVDGRQWTEVVTGPHRICQVTTVADRFIATGEDTFLLSPDGTAWTPGASSQATAAARPGWGHYRRHAVGHDGLEVFAGDYDLESGDGKRVGWTGCTQRGETALVVSAWPGDICGLAYGDRRFVACGAGGQVLMSSDGVAWREVLQTGDQHQDGAVRYGAGAFWLYGQGGVRRSPDGVAWAVVAESPHLPRATSPGGVSIDCGWGGIEVSMDGRSWRPAQVPIDATGICDVAWGLPLAALRTAAGPGKAR